MKKTQNEAIEKVNNKAIQRESIELTANILKRASEITDQTMQVMRPPLIRLDHSGALTGKIGEWAIEDSKDKEGKPVYAPLGAEFAAHVLKIRILLTSKLIKDAPSYYSYETTRWTKQFDLYSEGKIVGSGDYTSLKQKYPSLIFNLVLYLLRDGELARLKIKFPSTQEWFAYERNFSEKNPLLFATTIFGAIPAPDATVIKYSLMKFSAKSMNSDNYEGILEKAEELSNALNFVDKRRETTSMIKDVFTDAEPMPEPDYSNERN